MSINNGQAAALARARRLVEIYQSRTITSASLIGEIADLVTPDNVDEVIGLLPSEVKAQLGGWIRKLPPHDAPGIVCWPLAERTTLALKEWLQRHEAQECANHAG